MREPDFQRSEVRMNVLVLHEIDWLRKVVYEVHDFPELLSLRGHDVTVVDLEEQWERSKWYDLVRFRTAVRSGVYRSRPGARIELRSPAIVKLPYLDRFSSLFSQFAELRRTVAEKRIEVIFSYAMPNSGLAAIRVARDAGIPIIFRSIDALHLIRPGPLSRLVLWAEKRGYPQVDYTLALTRRLKDYVVSLGALPENVEALLPGMDRELFHPAPPDPALQAQWGLRPDDQVAVFIGTMFPFAGLDYLMENFQELAALAPRARLLLVGGGLDLERFRRQATQLGLGDRVIFTGFVQFEQVPSYINLGQVCINSFRVNAITSDVFPGKVAQYLACGKPLVCTPLPGTMDVLGGEENGVIFAPLGPEFLRAVGELLRDPARVQELGLRARRFVDGNMNWDRAVDRLEQVFSEQIARKKGEVRCAS